MSLNNWMKKEAAAPVENTMQELRALLEEGYTTVIYHADTDACQDCKNFDLEEIPLEEVIDGGAEYNAPIYALVHIGDTCQIEVTGPGLEPVFLDYSGRV